MSEVRRGEDGEPVPPGETVLRLGIPSMDFAERRRASPNWFELSSEDKLQIPPKVSVFCAKLTTPSQAWELQGGREEYTAAAWLNVDQVRSLRPEPDSPEVASLDVVWDHLDDPRRGAEGHAGVTGLDRRGLVTRVHTRSYRLKLADLATAFLWHEEE